MILIHYLIAGRLPWKCIWKCISSARGAKDPVFGLLGELWLSPWCGASCLADAGGLPAEGEVLNHFLTCIRARGFFLLQRAAAVERRCLSGSSPGYAVGCIVLADADLPETSPPLCLLYLGSRSRAAFHCILPLGEICL